MYLHKTLVYKAILRKLPAFRRFLLLCTDILGFYAGRYLTHLGLPKLHGVTQNMLVRRYTADSRCLVWEVRAIHIIRKSRKIGLHAAACKVLVLVALFDWIPSTKQYRCGSNTRLAICPFETICGFDMLHRYCNASPPTLWRTVKKKVAINLTSNKPFDGCKGHAVHVDVHVAINNQQQKHLHVHFSFSSSASVRWKNHKEYIHQTIYRQTKHTHTRKSSSSFSFGKASDSIS